MFKIKRILIIDDDADYGPMLCRRFQTIGFKTMLAAEGQEGLDKAESFRPSVILLDIHMPEMDGFALTERIKKSEKYAMLPVIIVSSKSKEEDRLAGIRVGADAYIVKGQFETRILLDVVNQFVR